MAFQKTKKNIILGIISLLLTVFALTFSVEVYGKLNLLSYDKTFIYAYICNSFFIFFLVIFFLKKPLFKALDKCKRIKVKKYRQTYIIERTNDNNNKIADSTLDTQVKENAINCVNSNNNLESLEVNNTQTGFKTYNTDDYEYEKDSFELRKDAATDKISEYFETQDGKLIDSEEFHSIAIILMILLYTNTVLLMYSIRNTSVYSLTTIYGTSFVFVSLFKSWFYDSLCSKTKVISLVICVMSIVVLYFFSLKNFVYFNKMTTLGDVLSLFSAFFTSIFFVLLDDYSKEYGKSFNILELSGYIGLYNFLCIPFFLVVIMLSGYERFILPSLDEFKSIVIYCLVIVIFVGICEFYAIAYLGSAFITLGLNLVAPSSLVIECFSSNTQLDWKVILVFILVLICFAFNIIMELMKFGNNNENRRDSNANDLTRISIQNNKNNLIIEEY